MWLSPSLPSRHNFVNDLKVGPLVEPRSKDAGGTPTLLSYLPTAVRSDRSEKAKEETRFLGLATSTSLYEAT